MRSTLPERPLILAVALLCMYVSASAARPTKEELRADRTVSKVRGQLDRRKAYKAAATLGPLIRAGSKDPRFFLLRAEAYDQLGEHAKSLADARAAQVQGAAPGASALWSGRAFLGLGMGDSATTYLERSVANGTGAEGHWYLAGAYQMQGRFAEAIAEAERSKQPELSASHVRAWRLIGECRAEQGDSAAARQALRKAVELAPRDPVGHNSLAYYGYAWFNDHATAKVHYDRAIKLNPNYAFAFNNRGWSRFKIGDREGALADIARSAKRRPGNPFVALNLARIADAEERKEQACTLYRQAMQQGLSGSAAQQVAERIAQGCAAPPVPAVPVAPAVVPQGGNAPAQQPVRSNAP